MRSVTIELPESLAERIEHLSKKEGVSLSEFLASAANEKVGAIAQMEWLKAEAKLGKREDFEKYLSSIPKAPPLPGDEL